MPREVIAVTFKLRLGAIDTLINKPVDKPGTVGGHMAAIGRRIERAAKRQVGVRTGRLRASIRTRQGRFFMGQYVTVSANTSYALMHHNGTRPHIINPNKRRVLRYVNRGKVAYATRVVHPGTKPNRFLSDNLYLVRM